MKTPTLFKEYIWLVNTIYHAGRISLADINKRWMRTDMSEGMPLSRTTFNRHKDAIEDITPTDEAFKMDKTFDANDFFSECYGVVIGDGTLPERIVLRAYGKEMYYLRDLPLHHTQKELTPHPAATEEDYADFEFFMRPTADFKGQLMSRGAWLKVLEPAWLAEEICQWHEDAIKKYQKT